MQNNLEQKGIWLVGFNLNNLKDKPDLFILIQTGDIDTPIMNNGKVLIFSKKKVIHYLYNTYEIFLIEDELYSQIEIIFDIEILIRKIRFCKVDRGCTILNSLNILFDMTKHLHKSKKHEMVKLFYSFASHLTYENEFAISFIKKKRIKRLKILDSIYWNLGLLIANSEII